MPTIRIREWTKERLEEIQEKESHSSHDSVIKSLLRDHELAQFAGTEAHPENDSAMRSSPDDKQFEDLTVFDELTAVENGVVFLWCPNCGNEMAHLSVENPIGISVYEMECQRCLTHLDQHAIVGIEIGYPIERRLADETLEEDLRACVIDYWDRTLERLATGAVDDDLDLEQLVWQFGRYAREFDWEWPTDVPVVGVDVGETYRDELSGDQIEVLERVTENRNELDSYRIRRFAEGDETGSRDDGTERGGDRTGSGGDGTGDGGDGETEVLGTGSLVPLLLRRCLYLEEP